MRRFTLERVAGKARVSPATVSRVLNNKGNVSERTRAKVLSVVKSLGKGHPANLVGLILPDAANPFFSQLVFEFEQVLEGMGYHVLASSSEGRPDREIRLIDRFRWLEAGGLIYISSGDQAKETILSLIADGNLPVVVFDRRITSGNFDSVTTNSRRGTLCAVDFLIAHKHERIAYLKGLKGTETARERFESFRDAMAQNQLELDEAFIFEGDYSLQSGRSCAERLLELRQALKSDEMPTAVLAANDLMAIGMMQRLQQEGLQVPRDLSIVGFDDIRWCEWTHPRLTTIQQPVTEMVRKAADLIVGRMRGTVQGNGIRPQPIVEEVEATLISRDSVAEPRVSGSGLRLISTEDSGAQNNQPSEGLNSKEKSDV